MINAHFCRILLFHLIALLLHSSLRAHDGIDQALEAVRLQPGNAQLHVRLATLHLEDHGDWASCLDSLNRASELDPSLQLDALRAGALARSGNVDEALKLYARHLGKHPEDAAAWVKLAQLHTGLKQPADAVQCYQKALALMPQPEPDLLHEAAGALAEAGKIDEAFTLLDKGPYTPVLAERAVQLAAAHKRWDEAIRRMDAIVARSNLPQLWQAKRAALLAKAGRKADAEAAWRQLQQTIGAMPAAQRQSRAMVRLSAQCREALAAAKP